MDGVRDVILRVVLRTESGTLPIVGTDDDEVEILRPPLLRGRVELVASDEYNRLSEGVI